MMGSRILRFFFFICLFSSVILHPNYSELVRLQFMMHIHSRIGILYTLYLSFTFFFIFNNYLIVGLNELKD